MRFANAFLERSLKANPDVRAFPPASGIMAMFGPKRSLWWFRETAHTYGRDKSSGMTAARALLRAVDK